MVSDKLRWSWAVAARGSATNTSLPISSDHSLWDKSVDYDFFNETTNSTWTNQSYTKYELVNIATATVLVLVILVTVVGKFRKIKNNFKKITTKNNFFLYFIDKLLKPSSCTSAVRGPQ